MGLEDELKGFVKPYRGLLWRMANVINPFLAPLIDGTSAPDEPIRELEEKRKVFLDLFKQLPLPKGATLIRAKFDAQFDENSPTWAGVRYFCGDLTVYELDFGNYSVQFFLCNKKLPLDGQVADAIQRIPIPGNTLSEQGTVIFYPVIDLNWEFIEAKDSKFYRNSGEPGVSRYETEHGLMEGSSIYSRGKFLSRDSLKQKNGPKPLEFHFCGRSSDGRYNALEQVKFDLRTLGYGELDAFMKHIVLAK